jgi:hypothetical protein
MPLRGTAIISCSWMQVASDVFRQLFLRNRRVGCKLRRCKLRGCGLRGCRLRSCRLRGCGLRGCGLQRSSGAVVGLKAGWRSGRPVRKHHRYEV